MAPPTTWFAPKRFGLGFGLPVVWQGWVLLGGAVAVLPTSTLVLPEPAGRVVGVVVVLALVAVGTRHAEEPFRWHGWH